MRQFYLPPNATKSAFVSGTQTNWTSGNTLTITLPDGIWQGGVLFIGGNNATTSYRGIMIQFSSDATKTQSFEVGSGSVGAYNNFYSKMAGASALSGTSCFNCTLNSVWLDATTRPNTLKVQWSTGTNIPFLCYSAVVYK